MKCMLGLRPWSAGASYLDGVDIKRLRPKEFWRRVGYVPQAKLSSFVYTVREMVLLGRSAHMNELSMPKERDERAADEALALVGIAHLRDKLCSKISGGEYQMALIARALAAEPSLLVLDEPESNLDFKNQRRVLSTISTLCKERGIAAIIAKSFARIYYRNCFNEGLPIIICADAVDAINAGDVVEIDFDRGVIIAGGKEYPFPPYPEFVQGLIKDGGLIPHVKKELGL